MDHRKSKRVPEKHLLLLYRLAKAFDCVDHNKLWKILIEMGIPDHLTCLLRHLYAGQEATVRTGHGTTDWFHIGKGVRQGCILSPCLFSLYAEYITRNAGQEEAQAGIKIAGRNMDKLRYVDDTTLMAESKEELKSLLMKVKGERKNWLKTRHSENEEHGTRSHHFMTNRWGNNGNSERLDFGGPKITADGDCSHEIKRCLLLGRKSMTNLDNCIKLQRHYITYRCLSSQSCGFSNSHVQMSELYHKEG